MRAFRRWLQAVLVLLSSLGPAQQTAQQSDQAIAKRILGPRWEQLSRRAGMIFAGTVLSTSAASDRAAAGAAPSIELNFRVDEPIAGVERGQILTIHEWAGAWSMHRPMTRGQRMLIFLYPPSRLGLTSPVGGSLGQIFLDSSGQNLSADAVTRAAAVALPSESSPPPQSPTATATVSVIQLERAIRAARNRNGAGSEKE